MSSIEEMPSHLRALYRNPNTEVPIWKAAALVMDMPPEEFTIRQDGFREEYYVAYAPVGKDVSDDERNLVFRRLYAVIDALKSMVAIAGRHEDPHEFTPITLGEVMQWCATHEGLHPKIWEGIDLSNPQTRNQVGDSQSEQATHLTIEQVYPFLDKNHPRYSGELAAAVYAWLAFEPVEIDSATKKSLEWWLEDYEEALNIGAGAIGRIATVANWDKTGGTPKAGSKAKVKAETPTLEAVIELLTEQLSQLTHQIQRQNQQEDADKFVLPPYITPEKLEQMLEQAVSKVINRQPAISHYDDVPF